MKDRIRLAWLAGAAALVYANTLSNGFTRDDDPYVLTNPQVTHPSFGALFSPHSLSSVFRPVTFASFAMNWAVGGASPFGYHLVNLLLQAAVACLLFLVLRAALAPSVPQADTVAFVAALIFAVHPIHTEAVSSVSGRPDLLAAGFLFGACLFHFDDHEIPALACMVLALLSKESAVVFLPLLLVCDFVRGQWKSQRRYAVMAGITGAYLAFLWTVQGHRFGAPAIAHLDNPLVGLSTTWRILNALGVAWRYVAVQIYPRVLSCDYSFDQIAIYKDGLHTLPAALAAAAVFAGWVWALRKRNAVLALAGGIYFAGFATTANILMPIGTIMGERLAYFPSAGFCLLVAAGWVWLANRPAVPGAAPEETAASPGRRQEILALGLLALILVGLGIRTMVRNLDWRNDFTLALSGVEAAPHSAKMRDYLGNSYEKAGQYDLAAKQFATALLIDPDYPDSLESLGLIELRWKNYPAAGWLLERAYFLSDRKNMNYDSMAVNLAVIYTHTKHLDGALEVLNKEIAQAPTYGHAWSARALVHYQMGQPSEADSDAQVALRLDHDNAQAQAVLQLLNAPPSPSSSSSSQQP